MTHIVVDDEHVASVAIELLKSSGAGRATFIPLNKIVKAPSRLNLPKDKGVIDFAINLVDFDDKYINAFYYAVGETLVVEDMECAKKLIGKYRMVTLQGEIFEKSGSMTGGSQRRTGLSFSQNDDDELEKLKINLKDLETKASGLIKKRDELENKREDIRQKYSDSMNESARAKMELANMTKNYENSENLLAERTKFVTESEPKIDELNKTLDKLEEQTVQVYDEMAFVQSEIEEVEKLIDEQDLKDLKEKTEGVEAEIKRLQDKLRDANAEKNDFNRDIAFQENMILTNNEDIERSEANNKKLEADKERFKSEIEELNKKSEALEEKLGKLLEERDAIQADLNEIEKQKNASGYEIEKIAEQIESFKARRRELEPQLETARTDLINAGMEPEKLEPVEISIEEITSQIQRLEKKMQDLGDVNMRAIAAYEEVQARQNELKTQIETLSKERKEILDRMSGYEQSKKEAFMKTYTNINENFKQVFHQLSEGEGELKLENPDDPLSGGLTIEAQPRDKKLQRLESMSGGEKSLTALAFVFAIQRYMPSPFYAFDEVDASLDTMNVERIAQMVQNQSKNTQFIVVSHRKPMIESANRTIGVTQKEKGITRVTGVKLRD